MKELMNKIIGEAGRYEMNRENPKEEPPGLISGSGRCQPELDLWFFSLFIKSSQIFLLLLFYRQKEILLIKKMTLLMR